MRAWLATFTRRWHANPDLCGTVDPVSAHSGRMGVLALALFGSGASYALLAGCLLHDLGESRAGDVPQPAKRDARLRAELDRVERETLADLGFNIDDISDEDDRRLKFLDRLDAFLWARHHAPHVLARSGWVADFEWLKAEAKSLGVRVEL